MNKIINYVIKDGDTLASVCQSVTGGIDKITQIALINNLNYPFVGRIYDTHVSGIVYPGDTIKIPIEDTSNAVQEPNAAPDCDIFLNDPTTNLSAYNGGDFETNSYGDLQTLEGDACIHQDLMNRVKTEKGTLLGHPTYGSEVLKFVGTKMTPSTIQDISTELTKTFLCDPRVKEVLNLNIEEITGGIKFTCVISTDHTQILLNESLIKQ